MMKELRREGGAWWPPPRRVSRLLSGAQSFGLLVSSVLGLLLVLLSLVPPLLELASLGLLLSVEVLAPVDAGTSLGREFWLPA